MPARTSFQAGFRDGGRRGNALLMMLPFLIFMLVFGYALIRRTTAEHTQSYLVHRKNVAFYAAEGVLSIADNYVRKELETSLKDAVVAGELRSLNLYEKAKIVKEQTDDLLASFPGLSLEKLIVDQVDRGQFPGGSSADPNDARESYSTLVFTAEVKYIDHRVRLDICRDVKVVNVTPPGSDYTFWLMKGSMAADEINRGQVIGCINEDTESGRRGKVRLEGDYKLVLGSKDYYDGSLPGFGMGHQSKSLLPPEWAASNSVKTSVGEPLADPGFAYDGIQDIENIENGKAKEHGKIRLFGSFLRTKKNLTVPTKVEGGAIKKVYLKVPYKLVFVTPGVPATPNSPEVPPTYHYALDHDQAQKIEEDYVSIGGVEGSGSPSPSAPATGGMVKSAADYKARATTWTEELRLRNFSYEDLTYIQGIHYAGNLIIGDEQTSLSYCGKSLIVVDNQCRLYNSLKVHDKDGWKEKSSLGIVHLARKVPTPFEFYKFNVKQNELEACLYSQYGIKYSGPGSPVWRRLYIYGNYVTPHPNFDVWKQGYIYSSYRNRLKDKENEALVAVISPVLSSFQAQSVTEAAE